MHLCFVLLILTALQGDSLLLQPEQLGDLPDAMLVDARSREAFEAGHIPGAAHLDVTTLSETRDDVRGLLKPVEEVRALVAEAGLDPNTHMVVYAASDMLKDATRLFWILEYLGYPKVSVLDGGYDAWHDLGAPLATGASVVDPVPVSSLPAQERPELLASKLEVANRECALVDLRSADEYAGASKKDFVEKPGHIPGADSVPADALVDGTTPRFRATGVIANILKEHGADEARRVVTYCNTGRDATIGYFAYRLAGHDDVAVYDGSMAEWAESEDVSIK